MLSFNPKDVIFVLNKWDTIPDVRQRDAFFEEIKNVILAEWEEVDENHIIKLSAAKVFYVFPIIKDVLFFSSSKTNYSLLINISFGNCILIIVHEPTHLFVS